MSSGNMVMSICIFYGTFAIGAVFLKWFNDRYN